MGEKKWRLAILLVGGEERHHWFNEKPEEQLETIDGERFLQFSGEHDGNHHIIRVNAARLAMLDLGQWSL